MTEQKLPRIGVAATALAVIGAAVIGTAYWVGTDRQSPPDAPPLTAPAVRLVAFDSCDKALAEMKAAATERVGPWGLDQPMFATDIALNAESAQPPGAAPAEGRQQQKDSGYSKTNNHEAAADEPDMVKTDGKRIVSIVNGTLRVVDVATRKLTATLAMPNVAASGLLLDGDRALVTTNPGAVVVYEAATTESPVTPMPGSTPPSDAPAPYSPRTTLLLIDLKDGAKVVGTFTVDGNYVDARQVGSVARVVITSGPRLPFVQPTGQISDAEALRRNKDVIAQSKISDWLPRHDENPLYGCESLSKPADYTGTSMLSVLTFDLRKDLGNGDAVGIAADGKTVYGTATSLYVADDRWAGRTLPMPLTTGDPGKPVLPIAPPPHTTSVHQFDIAKPGKPVYLASGVVQGGLLNQYSLSEHKGNLRIATTMDDPGCCDQSRQSQSSVAVLTRRGAELAEVGRVDGLGKTERIFAVRFLGDRAYVVTFRRTDPLYTLDLSDPAKPKVTGELKITGYSAYLHPVGEGKLLGVGQEATDQGRVQGMQVSLFDTTGAEARRVAQYQLKQANTEAEFDPHAFLYWADKGIVVLPLSRADARGVMDASVLVLRVGGDSVSEVARVDHPANQEYGDIMIRRSLVAGDALWTVSGSGMMASDLTGFGQLAWVQF